MTNKRDAFTSSRRLELAIFSSIHFSSQKFKIYLYGQLFVLAFSRLNIFLSPLIIIHAFFWSIHFLQLPCFSSIYLYVLYMQFFVRTFFIHAFFRLGVFSFAHFFVQHLFVHRFFLAFFRLALFRQFCQVTIFSSKYFNRESHLLLRFNTCPGLWDGQRCSVTSKRDAFTSARRLEPAIAVLVFIGVARSLRLGGKCKTCVKLPPVKN